jgi:ribonuclease HI
LTQVRVGDCWQVNKAAEDLAGVEASLKDLQLYIGRHEIDASTDSKSCLNLMTNLHRVSQLRVTTTPIPVEISELASSEKESTQRKHHPKMDAKVRSGVR